MKDFEKKPAILSALDWLHQYQIDQTEINFAKAMLNFGGPVHYRLSRVLPLVEQLGRMTGPFPAQPLTDFYVNKNDEPVPVMSSVTVQTTHIPSSLWRDCKDGKAKLQYCKPKTDGDYAWSVTWNQDYTVVISVDTVKLWKCPVIGSSYEIYEDKVIPHSGSVIPAFASIPSLEKHFGNRGEAIVGIRKNNMINEYKVKQIATVELEAKGNRFCDADGFQWGLCTMQSGIYECVVTGPDVIVVKTRPDKKVAQDTATIKEILSSPTYDDLRKLSEEEGYVDVPSILVGNEEHLAEDVVDWVTSDIFELGTFASLQTYSTLLLKLSAFHFRRGGNRLYRALGLACPLEFLQPFREKAFVGVPAALLIGGICAAPVIGYMPIDYQPMDVLESIVAAWQYPLVPTGEVKDRYEREMVEYKRQSTAKSVLLSELLLHDVLDGFGDETHFTKWFEDFATEQRWHIGGMLPIFVKLRGTTMAEKTPYGRSGYYYSRIMDQVSVIDNDDAVGYEENDKIEDYLDRNNVSRENAYNINIGFCYDTVRESQVDDYCCYLQKVRCGKLDDREPVKQNEDRKEVVKMLQNLTISDATKARRERFKEVRVERKPPDGIEMITEQVAQVAITKETTQVEKEKNNPGSKEADNRGKKKPKRSNGKKKS
jgi:hypothetical protein